MTVLYLIIAIILGSALSFIGGVLLLRVKKRRDMAILLTLPFGAGALLAAAFFDLLPEAFELGDPRTLLLWALTGFIVFFVLERCASWFHHHHEHNSDHHKNAQQRRLIVIGDITHNAIDGLAIGAAFLVSIPTGIVTALAVSAHEIPKELGTFALLLSRGWKNKTVLLANVATALATLAAALIVYFLGSDAHLPIGPLLALTAGFFIYVAASDIIPDIHEQPRRTGTIQAAMLVLGIIVVGYVIMLLGV
ncbi:MAG TPA: ZIP family metal transporter [Candidatus Saccharimonadales bacterium]|nr:ZIP family metal transporter [Candidatus Saccharimonadales bacterium]